MATETRKPRKSKRDEIKRAAMRVFCHYGYDGATLEKISVEAGVSKALVVKYYGSISNLLIQCLEDFVQGLMERMRRNAVRPGCSLGEYWDNVFELLKLSRSEMRLVLSLFLTPAHAEITRKLLNGILKETQQLMESFSNLMPDGEYREFNYTMFSIIVAYLIGGDEDNFRRARAMLLGCTDQAVR